MIHNFTISTNNSKLVSTSQITGKKIGGFNLPAGKTCPMARQCKEFCYASSGNFKYPNVVKSLENNWAASSEKGFVEEMVKRIKKKGLEVFRWHSSGDVYSEGYARKIIEIAEQCPNVLFYMYTKSWRLFNGMRIPSNLKMIYSKGSIHDHDLTWFPRIIS